MPDQRSSLPGNDLSWPFEKILEVQEHYDRLWENSGFRDLAFEAIQAAYFSNYWAEFVQPTSRAELSQRINEQLRCSARRLSVEALGLTGKDELIVDMLQVEEIPADDRVSPELYGDLISCRGLSQFSCFCEAVVGRKLEELGDLSRNPWRYRSQVQSVLVKFWESWKSRVTQLKPRMVGSVKAIYKEYLHWLKYHPNAIEEISWEAFERIIAEVFASRGFDVSITARVRNASSDLIAVRRDEFGVDTRYLIEVKRYARHRKVGLDVVNAVLGAATRAGVEHAFLVTSSSFSSDVELQRSKLTDLRLHLRDGDQVKEWLADYQPQEDGGLWLPGRYRD